ncbi:MAG: flavin reductase family protein [Armatimonadota bacterium]|nr:flavin reductase family protein [Armatimonadota bacterium]MDR5697079.1 flavin reductase family protein [Armatimonadota bacterium]
MTEDDNLAPDRQAQGVDAAEFRRVMGLFATGVTVVTAHGADGVHGMTANAVMSVSLDPLLVCVSIDRRARMNDFLQRAGGFALNILTDEQQALSQYFAGAWPHERPPEYRFEPWVGGPRLVGVLAAVGCAVHDVLPGGDHRLFLGRVLALHRSPGRLSPLLFFGGRYHRLRQAETAPRDPVEVWNPEEVQIFYGD